MAPVIMFEGGPKPPPGQIFCTVCSMLYKGQALQEISAQVEAAKAREGTVWLKLPPPREPIHVAVARGIYPPLQQVTGPQPLDLCWSHLMGLNMTTGLLPASAAQMPQNLPAGVPLLGRGQRP